MVTVVYFEVRTALCLDLNSRISGCDIRFGLSFFSETNGNHFSKKKKKREHVTKIKTFVKHCYSHI
jgi:hypothetical protein